MKPVKEFRRILTANRGEIAIRVFRACTELGRQTIAIYSEADSLSLHRYKADEAYLVGTGLGPVAAYLDIDSILGVARTRQVDAIHPGYGFLAENAEFARRCQAAGIAFIGPAPEHLELLGDKVRSRAAAEAVGLPLPPGTPEPIADADEALAFADSVGYPVMVKAVAGGGGRGMRRVRTPDELRQALQMAQSEARAAFGNGAVFLEKVIRHPRHVEVQVIGDTTGRVVHLWERDCSVQRRHQKVVEMAPAVSLDPGLRREICDSAVALMGRVGYVGAGTVEFLVDREGGYYFLEVNPRVQVEHTVTEAVTGVDIVQTQIRVAEGYPLDHPDIGLEDQDSIRTRGCAIQCRVTTEDPENDFLPDTGRILAYRAAEGPGVRLDGGNAYAGALISPHYDSLLVKITTWGRTFDKAALKMLRSLREFRIRGVKTNLLFLENVIQHPEFLSGRAHTALIDEHPELFQFPPRRDRGTKLLRYIGHVVVNGADGIKPGTRKPVLKAAPLPQRNPDWSPPAGTARSVLQAGGPGALADWIRRQDQLLLTDTTFRDAHQSLLATRVRSHDLLRIAGATGELAPGLFSLEMWGGATFDTALRFLKEDPWDRLDRLREAVPHVLFQMLLRGANAVGYSSYPDNVVRLFVREAAAAGVDIFRIFDSLNWLPNMQVALDEVLKSGAVAEVAICFTGDLLDPNRDKYDLKYYVDLAREIERAGAHILAIKDMAGLLKPEAAYRLIRALKDEVGLPIHLHTHDSAGAGVATVLRAAAAGVDIADGAVGSMAAGTSQPSLGAIIAGLEGTDRTAHVGADALQALADYWEVVRGYYFPFEGGTTAPNASVYRNQMPGGQYTNLRQQAEALGLGSRWTQVVEAYRQVDEMLGEVIKVTPTSKAVGDMALFMVQNDLTPENILERGAALDFPDSVVGFFQGLLGRPPYGFPAELQQAVLKGRTPLTARPGAGIPPTDLPAVREELSALLGRAADDRELSSYLQFPEVYREFARHREEYGDTSVLDTPTFFYGLRLGEKVPAEIEPGKTLIIELTAVGEARPDGTRAVLFELNGTPREVGVRDRSVTAQVRARPKADRSDWRQVAAAMPGKVLKMLVATGAELRKGEQLLVTEAMKMETALSAPRDARVAEILVQPGDQVEAGDLLLRLESDL